MTMKSYIQNELCGRGYSRFDDIPDEMFDYLPEYLDNEEDSEDLVLTANNTEPLSVF